MSPSPLKEERTQIQGRRLQQLQAPAPVTEQTVEIVCIHSVNPLPVQVVASPVQCVSQLLKSAVWCTQNVIARMVITPPSIQKVLAGQLHHFHKNLDVLTKDQWILETVRGYQLDLSEPTQRWRPHPQQFNQNQEVHIQQKVELLQEKVVVIELLSPREEGFFSTLFLVPNNDEGQKPVVNMKALKQFVLMPHFKMEGIHTIKNLLRRGDWLAKVDLKDAYFAIPIHPDHRKYRCFSVGNKTYQFTCLPFGLAPEP